VFARLGFRCIQRLSAERSIMRLELTDEAHQSVISVLCESRR
jgi:hypothetical protein